MLGGVVATAVLVVALAIALGGSTSGKPAAAPAAQAGLFEGIPQQGEALGSPRAPVTLEEFADLQCPYCRDYAVGALPEIVKRYVRTGKLRLVFRPLAFIGPESLVAARTAAAAGQQNHMWDFVHGFYARQGEENSGYVTTGFLREVGDAVRGLDVDRALGQSQTQSSLEPLATSDTRARALHIDSTPSFVIGPTGQDGHRLGVRSLDPSAFSGPIERELSRVRGSSASSTAADAASDSPGA
jgi:protein-disulfide isomerase